MNRPTGILVIYPLQVPTYVNAGHHLALYQVAGHLRALDPQLRVDVIDGAIEQVTWKDLAMTLVANRYDCIAVMNDLEGVDGTERTLAYARRLLPEAKLISFGRMTSLVPHVIETYDFDAIVVSGDFETGVASAVEALTTDVGPRAAAGVSFLVDNDWTSPVRPGTRLPADQWYLPHPDELPLNRYEALYSNDARQFSGLAGRRELVVPVARGCPVGCSFCEVPTVFGSREVRLSVDRTIAYINSSFAATRFDYVSFYAPTFTLNRSWVIELCKRLRSPHEPVSWKCCTTLKHLDNGLVDAMGLAGCVRISVGLETLDAVGLAELPRAKEAGARQLADVADWCRAANIELNCFVVVGLPGTSLSSDESTIAQARALGARVRPTFYTDWQAMPHDAQELDLAMLNRHLQSRPPTITEDGPRAHQIVLGLGSA